MDYEEDVNRMSGLIDRIMKGDDEDLKWFVGEFSECVEMLGAAIDDARAHCVMLNRVCQAFVDRDAKGMADAVMQAIEYHEAKVDEDVFNSEGLIQ